MASKVGLKEEEYRQLEQSIQNAHNDILEQISNLLKQIDGMNGDGGVFFASSLSPKITLVTGEIKELSDSMSEIFRAHETVIESYKNAIENYDTCC